MADTFTVIRRKSASGVRRSPRLLYPGDSPVQPGRGVWRVDRRHTTSTLV